MKIFYYHAKHGNFGDDLNGWLWQRYFSDGLLSKDDQIVMTGIGTILGEPLPKSRLNIVFSSGIGYCAPPENFGGDGWYIASVRGPLTAQVLNLPKDRAVTDGAILLAGLDEYAPLPETERKGIVFMPHHDALSLGLWRQACDRAGIEFIDPRADSVQTAMRLRSARLVLADAMHAAIVADTMRVPWIPLVTSVGINSFKWLDWCQSMNLGYLPIKLPASSFLENLQNTLYRLLKIGYGLDTLQPEFAVQNYHNHLIHREKFLGPILRRMVGGGMKLLQKICNLPGMRRVLSSLDQRHTKRAAAALVAALQSNSYLSDDEIFAARLAEMQRRVEDVKRLAQ